MIGIPSVADNFGRSLDWSMTTILQDHDRLRRFPVERSSHDLIPDFRQLVERRRGQHDVLASVLPNGRIRLVRYPVVILYRHELNRRFSHLFPLSKQSLYAFDLGLLRQLVVNELLQSQFDKVLD